MLLTVEGGGFFSSSASGYSKGLTLLLLGQKHEDKPMRVSPWNHYQLVDQEPDPDLQLASIKNRFSRGCASFVCFGRTSARPDTPSPLKVGPVQQQDVLPGPLVSEKTNDHTTQLDDGNSNARKVALKSSLKKRSNSTQVPLEDVNDREVSSEKDGYIPSHAERRKVQWIDASGSELAEIREFEPRKQESSDYIEEAYFVQNCVAVADIVALCNVSETGGSEDEFDNGSERSCSCTIM